MKKLSVLFSILLCVVVSPVHPLNNQQSVYAIHTMFIYNFIKYIEWPVNNEKIVIAVWDNPSAAEEIEKMAKMKSTPSRSISAKNTKDENELATSNLIFVTSGSAGRFWKASEKLKSKPILIVTEDPDLIDKGAGACFKIVSNKLKFQLNVAMLKANGLKVASNLESLAVK